MSLVLCSALFQLRPAALTSSRVILIALSRRPCPGLAVGAAVGCQLVVGCRRLMSAPGRVSGRASSEDFWPGVNFRPADEVIVLTARRHLDDDEAMDDEGETLVPDDSPGYQGLLPLRQMRRTIRLSGRRLPTGTTARRGAGRG